MVVAELLQWGSPLPLVLLTVLLQFHPRLRHKQDYDFVELFSGDGEVSGKLRQEGLAGASMDLKDNPTAFDLTTDVGFALALNSILRLRAGGVLVLAICCESFSVMSRSTSGRTVIHPLGNRGLDFVSRGNLLLSRSVMLLLVATCKGCRFLLEQPAQSCLADLPRWSWFVDRVHVMRGYCYMGKFGGPSPKRHVAWSNDEAFVQELLARGGFMSITERNALGTTKLVKRGHKNGVPTFTGCKKLLKNSQRYTERFGHAIVDIFRSRQGVQVAGPKAPRSIDWRKSDYELFRDHLHEMKDDLCQDANVAAVIRYVGGCRQLSCTGHWGELLLKIRKHMVQEPGGPQFLAERLAMIAAKLSAEA